MTTVESVGEMIFSEQWIWEWEGRDRWMAGQLDLSKGQENEVRTAIAFSDRKVSESVSFTASIISSVTEFRRVVEEDFLS